MHRNAANLDGQIELVAGAFSSDPKKSKQSGRDFHLDPSRVYGSYQEMAKAEAALPADQRIDFVSIVVQNYLHFDVAKTFLQAGINVICDKPVTYTLEEARELRKIIKKSKKVFALTHNYTGYPMVKLAKEMVAKGDLGDIIKVVCEYPQGYAITALTGEDKSIANWRANPKVAGCQTAWATSARTRKTSSTTSLGCRSTLFARISVSTFPVGLWMTMATCSSDSRAVPAGSFTRHKSRTVMRMTSIFAFTVPRNPSSGIRRIRTISSSRMPVHQGRYIVVVTPTSVEPPPRIRGSRLAIQKGFIEAFANVYNAAAEAIRDEIAGKYPRKKGYDFPDISDGIIGMAFIETVVKSSKSKEKWVKFPRV